MNLYPFQLHSIALSTFASLIGPFGGFFASGFKRAFKIKVSIKGVGFATVLLCNRSLAIYIENLLSPFLTGAFINANHCDPYLDWLSHNFTLKPIDLKGR